MKTYIFVIEDNRPTCYYVEPEMISRLRNQYGNVYRTKAECQNAIKINAEKQATEIKYRHITDEERKRIEREQYLFAKSMWTNEDWRIVRENRAKKKSIDEQQLDYAREMMRRERERV